MKYKLVLKTILLLRMKESNEVNDHLIDPERAEEYVR